MKKPPDVIHIESKKEQPILKWVNLWRWAYQHNDVYLADRAYRMIAFLSS